MYAGATGIKDYPSHGAADRSDLLFAQRWPRQRRQLLPKIVAVHIDNIAEGEAMGANWRGRSTPAFLDAPPSPADPPRTRGY